MRDGEGLPSLIGPVGIGVFAAMMTVLTAVTVATVLLFIGLDWAPYMHTVCMTVAFAGVALGSILAGSRSGSHGWLVGLITGVGFILLCLFFSVLFGRAKEVIPSLTALRILAASITGAAGGILGVNFARMAG